MSIYSARVNAHVCDVDTLLAITNVLAPDSTSLFTLRGIEPILVEGAEIPTVVTCEGGKRRFYTFNDGELHNHGLWMDYTLGFSSLYGAHGGGFPLFSASGALSTRRVCALKVSDGGMDETFISVVFGDIVWCCDDIWCGVPIRYDGGKQSVHLTSLTNRTSRKTAPRTAGNMSSVNMEGSLISYTYGSSGVCKVVCDDHRSQTEAVSADFTCIVAHSQMSTKWIDDRTVAVIGPYHNGKPIYMMDIRNATIYDVPSYQYSPTMKPVLLVSDQIAYY